MNCKICHPSSVIFSSINHQPPTINSSLPDIETREHLEQILRAFYEKAFRDELIGRFFTEVVPLDLPSHIPRITDFWDSIVFNKQNYRKNVMEVHQHIHHLSAIQKFHLDRWLILFHGTIDERFQGPKASLMKQRATSIATLMDIKLNHGSSFGV